MARDFCKVSPRIWTGRTGRALRGHPHLQLAWSYILTSPRATSIGLFELAPSDMSRHTGMAEADCADALRILSGQCDFSKSLPFDDCPIAYDFDNGIVWVRNMAEQQIGRKSKDHKWVIGGRRLFTELLDLYGWTPVIAAFFYTQKDLLSLSGQCSFSKNSVSWLLTGETRDQRPETRDRRPEEEEGEGAQAGTRPAHVPPGPSSPSSPAQAPPVSRGKPIGRPHSGDLSEELAIVKAQDYEDGASEGSGVVWEVWDHYRAVWEDSGRRAASWAHLRPQIAKCCAHWDLAGRNPLDEMRAIVSYCGSDAWNGNKSRAGQIFGSGMYPVGDLIERLAMAAHEWKSGGQPKEKSKAEKRLEAIKFG